MGIETKCYYFHVYIPALIMSSHQHLNVHILLCIILGDGSSRKTPNSSKYNKMIARILNVVLKSLSRHL